MLDAYRAARGDPERMIKAAQVGVVDLERVIAEESQTTPASIAAIHKLRQAVSTLAADSDIDRGSASVRIRELESDLAQRLYVNFKDHDRADNYPSYGALSL
jgi:hypothetical protein